MKIFLTIYFTMIVVSVAFLSTGCSQKTKVTKYTSAATHKATMRSYKVLGTRYHPSYVEVGQVMRGISSWYGPNFHGKHTSNGEVYNMYAKTAAHKTWPMDTMVKVTNLNNGKSTIVRINDRGPFVKGRIIDCSYAAGKEIGLDRIGIAKVSVKVLGFAGRIEPSVLKKKSDRKTRVLLSNFSVQVGAFRYYKGAQRYRLKYKKLYTRYTSIIKHFSNVDGGILYRVWLKGFKFEQEAIDFKNNNALSGAFIVRN